MFVSNRVNVLLYMIVQTLGAGTFDEVFGPGNTPMWALPTDVVLRGDIN